MRTGMALAALITLSACQTPPHATPVSAELLNGTWDVTLYYSPTEPPSATVMEIKVDGPKTLSGSFYQSDFLDAEYSLRNGVLAFAAVTTDGNAPYNTSGRYVNGQIEGQTHSLGRDFLMIWTATRRPGAPSP